MQQALEQRHNSKSLGRARVRPGAAQWLGMGGNAHCLILQVGFARASQPTGAPWQGMMDADAPMRMAHCIANGTN